MNETLIETLKQWNIITVLPLQVGDFQLSEERRMIREQDEDKEYLIFIYRNDRNGWTVRAVFNPASGEFSIRTDIGMLEFALIEFITDVFDQFRAMVEERLPRIIQTYYVDRCRNFSVILQNKGLPAVAWDSFLPEEYKGFRRLVKPNEAVRIINGSYMVLSYYNAETKSGLSVMYNVLRDDFFAERRIHNFPNLVHDFDSESLRDLQSALQKRLLPVLDEILADMD
ncbi:hypothetical protein [Megasphaera cerevisiae]|jgi:hypothetical protein|uniref:hypothetical protein n=1 Tax=Megasphaera cerevisiae TaxID=39029 RepID=UPI0009CAC17E|nr:hypothetical protein [Megasphaera cerevisiae]MCI1751139.1 hypothetical protein [Megasphaera cerevisiae]SJZ45250.1 hypothetical protein SAMN05660900_00420 [Megasphaera cerevisiae DSM 20462]